MLKSEDWDKIITLADRLRVSFILAGLLSEHENPDIPDDIMEYYQWQLNSNKARNASLSLQIRSIAQTFHKSDIPFMFIKGGACLARGLYPAGWRSMTDLDILVHREDKERALDSLLLAGYNKRTDGIEQTHHMPPLFNPDYPGEIELHTTPYPIGAADQNLLNGLWTNSDKINFMGASIIVPNPTDHVWIMLRTDTIGRVTIPRLSDIIEYSLITDNKLVIDNEILIERAKNDKIPNLVKAFLDYKEPFDINSGVFAIKNPDYALWEKISRIILEKELQNNRWHSSRRRFLAIRFLPSGGLKNRIKFGAWLTKEIVFTDRFEPGEFKEKPLISKTLTYLKIGVLFFISGIEYLIYYLTVSWKNKYLKKN